MTDKINSQLRAYIENEIFPLYQKNEAGHNLHHIQYVIKRSFYFASKIPDIDWNIVYTVAAYHDLGHGVDPKHHEIFSAQIAAADKTLPKFFQQEQLRTIVEAIADHRASSDHEPRSIYGKIVSMADRGTSVDSCIFRAYSYGKHLYPQASDEKLLARAYEHLQDKFGVYGYAKYYFQDLEYEKFRRDIQHLLADKKRFLARAQGCISNQKDADVC